MTMKNAAKIDKELTCRFKTDMRNCRNFDPSTQKSKKKFVLICSLWPKYKLFELPKYKGVIFHDTEKLCKFLRKTDLWFQKRREKYGKFLPEHMKVSKLGLWWDSFAQSRKGMSLSFTKELCVMTIKNNAKFKEELTCHFKIGMRNLTNFVSSTRKFNKIAI